MTMRLDIVTNDAGELVRLEHARDMGSATVQAVYRLLKLVQIHDLTNQAFVRQLEQTHEQVTEYGLRSGTHFNVLFASKAVFVGGQLLKGSRAAYDAATELGDILEWCGGSDLTIQKDVAVKEVQLFAEAVGAALRGAKGGSAYKAPSPKIRLRPVTDAARFRGLEVEQLAFEQKVVRTYASAVVIMRRFFADLSASRYVLPRRIKRVAQSLVDLSDGSTPAFLGVTDVRNQNFDDAGRAVNTAILAVSMARELTHDRVLLAQIAMAAMMHDVGRPRAAALGDGGPRMPGVVRLSEDAEDKLAAGTAAVLTALGRVNEPTITRTVVAFEALWLRRERFLGPLYAGSRIPTVHAKIVQISRRYNDLVTPEPGLPPPQPDFAIATLAHELPDPDDRAVLRLLVATLNLLPVGTVVQLTTNEVAEIITSRSPTPAEGHPWVSILRDAHGQVLQPPVEVDLGARRDGDPERRIEHVLSIDGWGKGLELVAEGSDDVDSSPPPPRDAAPPDERRLTLDTVTTDEVPLQLEEAEVVSPSSASVPSIASLLAGPPKDYEPSNISEASPSAEGWDPSSGTSPSMVAEAMGRVMEKGAVRAQPDRRSRGVALFEDPMIDVVAQLEELEPTARGTLTSTPIVHVLVYMLDHRQTGTVVLREVDGRHHVIYFREGSASLVRNGRPVALLGDGLVASGLLSPDVLVKALDVARRAGSLLGQYLTGSGLVAKEALRMALAAQVPRKLERLVNLAPDTDYAFYGDINLVPDWANGELFPCQPLTGILAAVRSWHDRARIRATLGRIAKQPLTFHQDADLSGLVLNGEEQAVVDAIHHSANTLSTIYDLRVAGEDTVSSLVYTFAVTRSFGFTAAKGPPMVVRTTRESLDDLGEEIEVSHSEPPPRERDPHEGKTKVGGLSEEALAMLRQAHAQKSAARAPESVAPTAIVASPLSLHFVSPMAQRTGPAPQDTEVTWRPAKVPESHVADVAAGSLRAQRPAPIGDAPASLTGAPPSLAFRESQVRKAQPRVQQVDDDDSERLVQAMADFRMAETALSRDDTSEGERLAKKALAAEPTNPDYAALVAWTSTLLGAKDAIPLAIAKLNVILKEDAFCERALLYRGRLYKRAKRNAEALRDFGSVLDVNPNHAEAATEARLLRMKKK